MLNLLLFDELVVVCLCLMMDIHDAMPDFRFWACWILSGNLAHEDHEDLHAVHELHITCGFTCGLHELAATFPADFWTRVFCTNLLLCHCLNQSQHFLSLAKTLRFG